MCDSLSEFVATAREALRFESASNMPPAALLLASAVAVVGTVAQIIGLNFWLAIDKKSPFTTAAVVAIFWDAILWVIVVCWIVFRLKGELGRFAFLRDVPTIVQLFVIGCLEGAGTLAVSYSALGTSEALQSLLKATVVPLTAVFTVFVYKLDPGVQTRWQQLLQMCKLDSLFAVFLIVAAVAILAFGGEKSSDSDSDSASAKKDSTWLPFVCFLGAIFNALHFVLQGQFMDAHTIERRAIQGEEGLLIHDGGANIINDDDNAGGISTIGGGGGGSGGNANDTIVSATTMPSVAYIEDDTVGHHRAHSVNAVDDALDTSVASGVFLLQQQQQQQRSDSELSESDDVDAEDLDEDGGAAAKTKSKKTKKRHAMDRLGGSALSPSHPSRHHRRRLGRYAVRSDDFTVKLSMLAVDTFFQIIFTFVCLPFDAIHGFGPHENVSASWSSFTHGFRGIFHDSPDGTAPYFLCFLVGFCSSHLAFAYLNHYSPTYTPMVMILASPITNLALLIFPKWNAHATAPVVWASVVSAVLMVFAAVVFARWELGRKRVKRQISSRL